MRVAIYIRVSTEEQAKDGFSISAQRQKLMQYCELQDWDIYDIYIDDGYSGAKLERPDLNRLRKDIQQRNIDMVLVWRVDRFFRHVYYLSTFLHEMENNNISFKSMTEGFDTSHPSGKAMMQMLAIFAEWERETIRERVINALSERARQGLHHGQVPYGYNRNEDGILIPDEPKAQVIRDIFNVRNKDKSKQEVVDFLIAKYGIEWLGFTREIQVYWFVDRVLRNPVYAGKVVHNDDIYDGEHEPLVSHEDFLATKKLNRNRYETNFFIFRGIMHCGKCGDRMQARRKVDKRVPSGEQRVYFCPHSQSSYYKGSRRTCNGKQLDENAALRQIVTILKKTSIQVEKNIHSKKARRFDKETRLKVMTIEARIKELRKRRNKYFEIFEDEPEFENDARERIRELSQAIQVLELEKEELQKSIKQESDKLDIELIRKVAAEIDVLVAESDKETLRDIFMTIFSRIIVKPLPDDVRGRVRSYVEVEWNT